MTATLISPFMAPPFEIDARHLSVTATDGHYRNVHIVENGDLGVGDNSAHLVRESERGSVLIALGIDDDHDEIHFSGRGGGSTAELLKNALEAIILALAAIERAEAQA